MARRATPVEWWKGLPEMVRDLAKVAVFMIGGGAVAVSGDNLDPRVTRLEASTDTTHESRIVALERWKDVDLVATRYQICRFDQEDAGRDPRECRHIITPYEDLFGARPRGVR